MHVEAHWQQAHSSFCIGQMSSLHQHTHLPGRDHLMWQPPPRGPICPPSAMPRVWGLCGAQPDLTGSSARTYTCEKMTLCRKCPWTTSSPRRVLAGRGAEAGEAHRADSHGGHIRGDHHITRDVEFRTPAAAANHSPFPQPAPPQYRRASDPRQEKRDTRGISRAIALSRLFCAFWRA